VSVHGPCALAVVVRLLPPVVGMVRVQVPGKRMRVTAVEVEFVHVSDTCTEAQSGEVRRNKMGRRCLI